MSAPTLETLVSLPEGAPISWRGEAMTFVGVEEYRGGWVVWLLEVNGPIGMDRWQDLEVTP